MDLNETRLQSAPGARSQLPMAMMRAMHVGASAAGEPLLQPRPPPDAGRLRALRLAVSPNAAPQRPFSVLLVDGDNHHSTPLLRALRDQKYTVLSAVDGASGEHLFQMSRLEIDVLIACADMNRMCGFELARRLRCVRPEIRVLLMCRHFAGPDAARGVRERGYPVIEEPFTPEELCRRLTALLASSRNDTCADRLDGEDRITLCEREVLAIDSKQEGGAMATREIRRWSRAKTETSPTTGRRSCKRCCRS